MSTKIISYYCPLGWSCWPQTCFIFGCLHGTGNYYVCSWSGSIGQATKGSEVYLWRTFWLLLFAYLWSCYSSEIYNGWRIIRDSWAFNWLSKGMHNKKPLCCFFSVSLNMVDKYHILLVKQFIMVDSGIKS